MGHLAFPSSKPVDVGSLVEFPRNIDARLFAVTASLTCVCDYRNGLATVESTQRMLFGVLAWKM